MTKNNKMDTTVDGSDLLKDTQQKTNGNDVDREDNLDYDLGNLTAFDPTAPDTEQLKADTETYLKSLSRTSTQLLFNHIFHLETEDIPRDVGRLVLLPHGTTPLPRGKPIPKPAPPTRWEVFAKQKGIQKKKRGRMEFDEQSESWKPRWGYGRAKGEQDDWAVEAKAGEDLSVDPWTRMKNEKKERINKNKKQQDRNLREASGQRVPGTIDLTTAVAKSKKNNAVTKESRNKNKHHVDVALSVVQHSTASMGKFDSKRYKEPTMKAERTSKASLSRPLSSEKASNMNLLSKVLGKSKDNDGINMEKATSIAQQSNERAAKKQKRK